MPLSEIQRKLLTSIFETITEQKSTFTWQELRRASLRLNLSSDERQQLIECASQHPDLLRLTEPNSTNPSPYLSTRSVRAQEAEVLQMARQLSQSSFLERLRRRVRWQRANQHDTLDAEQRDAFRYATAPGRLKLINGRAGTGKSHTMSAIRRAFERDGKSVIGLAPTNLVARDMSSAGFETARTLHLERYLLERSQSSWSKHVCVVVDEASMIDSGHLHAMLSTALQTDARLILVGDTRQLQAIGRPGLFGILSNTLGAVELTANRRQRHQWQKEMVAQLSDGYIRQAIELLEQNNVIRFCSSKQITLNSLAQHWREAALASPSLSRFVFAYTNRDVRVLNTMLRAENRRINRLYGADVTLKTPQGRLEIAVGDSIVLTSNKHASCLFNGMAGTVQAVTKTNLTFVSTDGNRITFDPRRYTTFDHGYAGTIHRGQGRTFDETFLFFSSHWTQRATYVALTRHRESATVFVDASETPTPDALTIAMSRSDDRPNAIELEILP